MEKINQREYLDEVIKGLYRKANRKNINDFEVSCLGMAVGNLDIICDCDDEKIEVLECLKDVCYTRIDRYGDMRVYPVLVYVEAAMESVEKKIDDNNRK